MYECNGQMSLFDFIQDDKVSQFEPLKALALRGSGFENGMDRIYKFFTQNSHTIQEKAQFLKKEYGLGGFGSPTKKPCYIHDMDTFGNNKHDIQFKYYDEDMNNIQAYCSWNELAKVITEMISKGEYVYKLRD